jgi:hypothetical protein
VNEDEDAPEPIDLAYEAWWDARIAPRFTGDGHTYTPDELHEAFDAGWEARAATMGS